MPEFPVTAKDQYKLKVINQALSHKITNDQAAKFLRLSVRQIKRLKKKVKQQGMKAVVHGLKGRVSNNHISFQIKDGVRFLIKEKYSDFKPSFAAEKLKEYHNLVINPETLRLWVTKAGLWKIHKQNRLEYHAWRDRKEYFGELQQFDGSYHLWFEGRLTDEYANSPQAKDRVERLFETLQDRLVKELRLNNISTLKDGSRFLKEIFIPKFNVQFSLVPKKEGNVHRILTNSERKNLKSIFSIKYIRRVNLDFTIQFKNHFYQLEELQPVTLRPKESILVEQWLNQTIHFKFKDKYLKAFILPEKPKKISKQPVILTPHPLNWKPPPDHPWRLFKFSTKRG